MNEAINMENRPEYPGRIDSEINVTSTAMEQIQGLLSSEDDIEAVRIFVAGGGCGGMTYSMTFAPELYPHDSVLERDGVRIYVDAIALNYLDGVEIDFVESATGASFVFRNVFQAVGGGGTCGSCGMAGGGAC
ncbi:MAG: iron-sulfur cluster assembly accessory protein [Pseudomonadota bacterium]|nr:iron-sulfur cluster assembly accessory protein [Pseudomonadota bacterium]